MAVSEFQYELYRVLAPAFAVALLALLAVARTRSWRANPASGVFVLYVAATIGFLVVNTLEISAPTPADNLFWSRVIYLFIPFIPLLWFSFTYRIARDGKRLEFRFVALLLIVPILTLAMVFSDAWMEYVWASIEYVRMGSYYVSVRRHGAWFAFYSIYVYLVAAAGLAIAIHSFSSKRSYFQKRSVLLLAGVAFPILANAIYLLKPIPGLVKDFTPIAYAVSAFFFFFAIHRLDAFSVVPVAREQLVERMSDGILVFDAERRIADANKAALEMLGADERLIGSCLSPEAPEASVLPPEVASAALEGRRAVYSATRDGGRRVRYSVEAIDLPGRFRPKGRLLIIRDETELRDALDRLEELAKTDSLTGLANRRGFMERGEALSSTASRYDEALAAAMFDLDRFKNVNDEWGHAMGDEVLRAFAAILLRDLRGADQAGRIGGEEFALLLPRTEIGGARIVCERIRKDFAKQVFSNGRGETFSATVSVGIAAANPGRRRSLEALLEAADSALYKAKAAGRNRTAAEGEGPGPEDS